MKQPVINHIRVLKQINEAVKAFVIDVKGLNVLTEMGSNAYLYTPLIPFLAGAKSITVWSQDSIYGKAVDFKEQFLEILKQFNIPEASFTFSLNKRDFDQLKDIDIVCNHGALRPIDHEFILHLKKNKAVISLMYDQWELREEDIDLTICRENNIKVGGTWEKDPTFNVFCSVGNLALKMAFEAGFEIYKNRIVVWSDDEFGDIIQNAFLQNGAQEVVMTVNQELLLKELKTFDFIFFCDYSEERQILGEKGFLDVELLKEAHPYMSIIHLYGNLDDQFITNQGISLFPFRKGKVKTMSHTLSYLGITPTIWLNTAGLKVAECLIKKNENPLCQRII